MYKQRYLYISLIVWHYNIVILIISYITDPPTIIDEQRINKHIVSKLFYPEEETKFSFNFTSNPDASFSWWLLSNDDETPIKIDPSKSENAFLYFYVVSMYKL